VNVDLATNLALALTLRHFAPSPTLGDVRLLVHGRVHLWPGWETDNNARAAVARFFAVRPDDLADDGALIERAREVLESADDFEPVSRDGNHPPGWDAEFRHVAGSPLDDRIALWFAQAERKRGRSTAGQSPEVPALGMACLVGAGRTFSVPSSDMPAVTAPTLVLRTAPPGATVRMDRDELLALACAIDESAGNNLYAQVGIRTFLDRLVDRSGEMPRHIGCGVTKLANAPTGTGKSVFARLLALHLARNGMPVALVVPDILTVWKESRRLEAAARSAALSVAVTPLSSWRNLAGRLSAYLDDPPPDDPKATWAMANIGYSCHLAAYADEGDGPAPGDEPCTRLRQRDAKTGKERKVACPFAETCGRFSGFRRAAQADIVVVNHHAFLGGRVPIEVTVDGACKVVPGLRELLAQIASPLPQSVGSAGAEAETAWRSSPRRAAPARGCREATP
jgi:hypothetical protein